MKETLTLKGLLGPEGPGRVLIVEDERTVREGLSSVLSLWGYTVDARPGVERDDLPLVDFDVAFLDNYFLSSSLTGVSLAPELRASCPSIRIIAMSSDAGKNVEMMRLGADLAVAKSALRRLL